MTATAKKNNMRIITVAMGEPESSVRNSETSEMLDYSFAQYSIEQLLSKNSSLGKKEVEKGKDKYVELVPIDDVTVLNKKLNDKKNATYELKISKLKAPLKHGDVVGKLTIIENDEKTRIIDVTVKKNVKKANIFELYWRYLKDILVGDIKL